MQPDYCIEELCGNYAPCLDHGSHADHIVYRVIRSNAYREGVWQHLAETPVGADVLTTLVVDYLDLWIRDAMKLSEYHRTFRW